MLSGSDTCIKFSTHQLDQFSKEERSEGERELSANGC